MDAPEKCQERKKFQVLRKIDGGNVKFGDNAKMWSS